MIHPKLILSKNTFLTVCSDKHNSRIDSISLAKFHNTKFSLTENYITIRQTTLSLRTQNFECTHFSLSQVFLQRNKDQSVPINRPIRLRDFHVDFRIDIRYKLHLFITQGNSIHLKMKSLGVFTLEGFLN